jgi:hypothetical protein
LRSSARQAPQLGALALEDEANQTPPVTLTDRVEGDRTASALIGAHDRSHPCDRDASGQYRQAKLNVFTDLQGV